MIAGYRVQRELEDRQQLVQALVRRLGGLLDEVTAEQDELRPDGEIGDGADGRLHPARRLSVARADAQVGVADLDESAGGMGHCRDHDAQELPARGGRSGRVIAHPREPSATM